MPMPDIKSYPTHIYSTNEEVLNTLSHVVGIYISTVIGTMICQTICSSPNFTWLSFLGMLAYCFSTVFMYTMSSAYHCVQYLPVKRWLRLLDHVAIYFTIAGTSTPIGVLLIERGGGGINELVGTWVLVLQWMAVFGGTVFKVFTVGKFPLVSTIIYVILGWTCAIPIVCMYPMLSSFEAFLVVGGGAIYTIGSVFYSLQKMRYFHGIWHVFVLVGGTMHEVFMLELVKRLF